MKQAKTSSRLLALLLSLTLVIGMLPTTVFAETAWGGTGVAEVKELGGDLYAEGNNLVVKNGSDGDLTQIYYANTNGVTVGNPINLSEISSDITGDTTGGFDLKNVGLSATHNGTFNNDTGAFANLDVVIWMEGGTLADIAAGNINAQCKSFTVHMSGGTLTSVVTAFNSAIAAHTIYISGGRIEKNQAAQHPLYLSGSPSIGGEGCGITVGANEKFYLNGALNGADVYVVPKADFADGTVMAEGSDYSITKDDISQLHLIGDYAQGKELYLENDAVKIRTSQPAVNQEPYEISTPEQLMKFAALVNGENNGANAVLTADIDMSSQSWSGIASNQDYTGVFDGQGHTIFNLTGTEGLFANNSGTVKNVRLENVSITREGGNLGAVVGVNTGTVFNCFSSGSITGTGTNAWSIGGLVGHNNGGILSGSASSCTVSGVTTGGLVGSNWHSGSHNYGAITACIYTGIAANPVEGDGHYSNSTNVYYKDENGVWKSYPGNGEADETTLLQEVNAYITENGGTFILSGDGTTYPTSAVSYLDHTENGFVTKYAETYTEINSENLPTTWNDGWYVVGGIVEIDSRVTVTGDVKLILKGGADLTVNGGIDVSGTSNSFTVYAQSTDESQMGSLTATAADGTGNAGIGSSGRQTAGAITVNGGRVTATGGSRSEQKESVIPGEYEEIVYTGAGIGGGEKSACSMITINGGIVTANPGQGSDFAKKSNSAAIGNGGQNRMDMWYEVTTVGTIVINGGSVNATGVWWGAGIGGGDDMPIASITINGGIVRAESDDSAGIGNGGAGDGGTITITGGTINAVSESACGIGGGYVSDIEQVVITGGDITATSDRGAGIGSCAYQTTAEVTISGGIVTATSNKGDGIGMGAIFRNDLVDFSTGTDGHAVIFASSIADQTGKDSWSSLIFQGNNGKVYGTSYTVDEALTIPADKILTIEHGDTLTVTSGVTLTNNGAIHVDHGGTYSGAHPSGNEVMYQIDWDTDGDGTVDDTTYVAYGKTPSHADGSQTGDAQYSYSFTGWTPTLTAVTGTATYTAQFTQSVNSYEVTVPSDPGYSVAYTGNTTLEYGSTFTFTVDIAHGYYKTSSFAVKANGSSLTPDTDGNYTVQVLKDTQITIEGVAQEAALAAPAVDTHGYNSEWTANDVTLTLSASADSGIAYYEYSKNGGESWTKLTGESLTISESNLATDYIFRAVSNAGNTSAESESVTVKIDKDPVSITLTGNTQDYLQTDTLEILVNIGLSGYSRLEIKNEDGTWTPIEPSGGFVNPVEYPITENGTYTFRAISGAGVVGAEQSITYTNIDSVKPVVAIDSGSYVSDTWSKDHVTLSVSNTAANSGTTTFQYKVDDGDWQTYTDSITISEETAGTTYTFKAISASGVESDETSITVKLDKTAPDGDIKIQENSVKTLLNQITFGLFFNQNVDVDITGTDALSGVASIQFYRSDDILTQEDVAAITDWIDYSSITETAADAEKFVYYAKITDQAGNFTVIGSNGVTFDLTAPTISGITNGSTYYTTQNVTVADANLATVTVNGVPEDEALTLAGNVAQTYTIVATDKAGNKTEYTVTMKPIESLGDPIQGITTDNVTSADQTDIQSVQQAVAGVDTENATQAEQDALKAIADHCATLLDKVTEVADEMDALTQAVNALPDGDTITSAHKDTVNDLMTRLDTLLDGSNLTEGEKDALEAVKAIGESLLQQIEQSAQAGTTENTDKVEDITPGNVSLEDQDDLTAAKEDLENALDNFGDNYTEEEKAALEDKLEQINQALESIQKVEAAQDAMEALPDHVEPDDTDAAAILEAVKEQYDALTEHEKSLVDEALKDKLDSLLAALVDYQIIEGNNSQWTVGENQPLTITANGAFAKFVGIQVDGVDVDAGNYTAVSGSTIITLKPDYLSTLSVGKHTLTVRFTDGQADGQFEILAKPETSTPDTGDNNQVTLWITVMFVAVCGLTGTMVYTSKKKHSK